MTADLIIESRSPEETQRLGAAIAAALQPGLTIGLDGELGSGKTQLVRSICEGLGVTDELVNSPTFVLLQPYTSGRMPIYHFDTYRLGDVDEFLAIGAEEYLNDETALCLIEWAQIVEPVLPENRLHIRLEQIGETSRRIRLSGSGRSGMDVVESVRRCS